MKYFLLVSLLGFFPVIFAKEPATLNISSALRQTVDNSVAIKNANLEIEIVKAQGYQDSLYPNPELNVEIDDFGGNRSKHWNDSAQISYSISQILLLGNKRGALQQKNAASLYLAEWNYKSVEQDLYLTLFQAYLAAYVAQEKLKIAEQYRDLAEQQHGCMQCKCQAGQATFIQEKKAALKMHSCGISVARAQNVFRAAKLQLASLWQAEVADFEELSFPLYCLSPLPSLSLLEEEALQSNPELAKAELAVHLGLAASDFELAMSIPDIAVTAGIETERRFRDHDFFVSLSFPLPLFNRNQGNRRRATLQTWQAAFARDNMALTLRNQLKISYQAWYNAYQNGQIFLELEQSIANESLHFNEESFQQGKIDKQELLEAKKSWLEIKEQNLDAAAEYHLHKIAILRLTAQLPQIEDFNAK